MTQPAEPVFPTIVVPSPEPVERDFPNIVRLLASILAPMVGGPDFVGSRTPDNLEQLTHFVRLTKVDGARTALVDFPTVELDYFFTGEDVEAERAAGRLVDHLMAKPPPHPSIDYVSCEMAPRELPWGDTDEVRRLGATLSFETRRVRVAHLP